MVTTHATGLEVFARVQCEKRKAEKKTYLLDLREDENSDDGHENAGLDSVHRGP